MMPRLERSASLTEADIAWADLAAETDDAEAHVAEAFAVVGLAPGSVLEPLSGGLSEDYVIAGVCLVGKGEAVPEGFEVLSETLCGQRASLNSHGAAVHLAVRQLPRRQATRPVTALALVEADHYHGHGQHAASHVPAGFEAIDRTVHGERVQMSKTLCVCRHAVDPSDPSPTAVPLSAVAVLRPDKQTRELSVPPGFELLERHLSPGGLGGGTARHLCVRRARPCGLLQTAFKAALLDAVEYGQRPTAAAAAAKVAAATAPSADAPAPSPPPVARAFDETGSSSWASSWASALPSALPQFCLPQGARLQLECPWPTAHEFALTDRHGARLYGCRCAAANPEGRRAACHQSPLSASDGH